MPNIEAIPGLLIAVALGPICAYSILTIIKWMMENQIDVGPGLAGIVIVILVMLVTILSKSHIVAGAVIVVLINLMIFLPYGIDQAARAELQGSDIDKLDRLHQEVTRNPENVSTYFAIADLVYEFGLPGHAVMIAETTLNRLSTEMDPIKNQSVRDVFKSEESRAREWRRRLTDRNAFKAVACPRCGYRNEPGTIACGKCRGPFLLDLARKIDPRVRIRSRLVLGWAIIAGFFTGTVYVWSLTEASIRWVALFGGLALIAVTFLWLFRPRRLGHR
jgi:hypothetical protein